jgi:DNA polymerase/3'-5' exonuclease PolX
MTKLKLSLDDAKIQAQEILDHLAPACQRIAVAGSIRRQTKYIGDVEIVAIPRYPDDLFGQPATTGHSHLDLKLIQLLDDGTIQRGDRQGPRYHQYTLPRFDLQLDLFITNPERWGLIYTLRTGSADFSRWLVTPRASGGALPSGHYIKDGRLWDSHLPAKVTNTGDIPF